MNFFLTMLALFPVLVFGESHLISPKDYISAINNSFPVASHWQDVRGMSWADDEGRRYSLTFLKKVGDRCVCQDEKDLKLLSNFLADEDPRIRFVASRSIINYLKLNKIDTSGLRATMWLRKKEDEVLKQAQEDIRKMLEQGDGKAEGVSNCLSEKRSGE